jgi:hypothetical protein
VSWPRYHKGISLTLSFGSVPKLHILEIMETSILTIIDTEEVLVFQKTDCSGEFPNATFGVPVGQGLHVEKDPDDRPICDFIIGQDAAFVH